MTISDSDILLLDTSVVVDIARNNRSGKAILETYSLMNRTDRPTISIITIGEMLGIAKAQSWNAEKTKVLNELFSELVKLDVTSEVVDAYADLVFLCRSQGHTMGQQNDMWIAATAKVIGGVLLTGDSDFNWLNPQFIRVEYIPRTT